MVTQACLYYDRVVLVSVTRSIKPRNRPAFRQIQMHLEIATPDWLNIPNDDFLQLQVLSLVLFNVVF